MATFRSTAPDLLRPWVTEIFFNRYNMIEELFSQVFNVVPSTKAYEDTFAVSGLGSFAMKPEGQPINYDDPVQSDRKRVRHSTYALGFRVTKEMLDDDQHNIISQMPSDLGDSARDHKENLAWALFNGSFLTAARTHTGIPDGGGTARSLCETGHVHLKQGGPSSNSLSPGVALSVSGIEAAVTNMRLTQNESGRQIQLRPSVIVAHTNEEFNLHQLLDSEKEPFTADNQVNSIRRSRLGLTTLVQPYTTDTDAWWLMTDKSQHSIKWYNRMDLDFDENRDAHTKDSLYDAMYRAVVTFDDWRGVVGSQP